MDKEGRPITKGGADFKVQITGPDGPFNVDVKDKGDGTYDGVYTAKNPGDFKVMVTLGPQKNQLVKVLTRRKYDPVLIQRLPLVLVVDGMRLGTVFQPNLLSMLAIAMAI